jgi:hypothetical protein
LIAVIGIANRVTESSAGSRFEATVVKATKPLTAARDEDRTFR